MSSTNVAREREMRCIHELGHMAVIMSLRREVEAVSVSKTARAKVLGQCVPKNPSIIMTLIREIGAHPDDPESVKLLRQFVRSEPLIDDFDSAIFDELQIAHAGVCAELLSELDRRFPDSKNVPANKTLIALVKDVVSLNTNPGLDGNQNDDFSKINVLLAVHRNRRIHSAAITATLSVLRDSKTQMVMKQLLPKLMTTGKLSKRDLQFTQEKLNP